MSVRTFGHATFESYTRMAGVEIPAKGRVTWQLPEGPFEYGRFEITSLAFRPDRVRVPSSDPR